MIIRKGNLSLNRLTGDDIELVRTWRNNREISQFMEYRDYISREMQLKWFRSVDNIKNLYSIVVYNGEKIGLTNGKNIDWEKRTMEGGVFIWDKKYQNSPVPVFIFILLADFALYKLKLTVFAHILKSNKRAQRFNKLLGFELCHNQEEAENQLYALTPESYQKHAAKLRKLYYSSVGNDKTEIVMEHRDFETEFGELFTRQLNREDFDGVAENEEGRVYYYST